MDSIIIGFSRPKHGFVPYSWLIRLITRSPFSHVYIKFYSSSYRRWLIYQASGSKVNFIGQELFNKEEVVCAEFHIPTNDSIKTDTIKFAIDRCGESYGVKQIIGFGWVLFMQIFEKKVKNPFYEKSSYFCSELVADILIEMDRANQNIDPASMSPKDIYDYLIAKRYKPKIPSLH